MRPWICASIAGMIFHIFRIIVAIVVGITTGLHFVTIILSVLLSLLLLGKFSKYFDKKSVVLFVDFS